MQIVPIQYAAGSAAIPSSIRKALEGSIAQAYKDPSGKTWEATGHGLEETGSAHHGSRVLTGSDGLPILSLTGIAGGPNEWLWLSSNNGAILFVPAAAPSQRWFYFWGKRYLSDNSVLQIVPQRDGAWIRTRTGISHIEFNPFTLQRKSEIFFRRVMRRHDRYGYVASSQLLEPGNVTLSRTVPNDNDGLWTSMFVAAEAFRYATTGSPEALHSAQASLVSLHRLVTITGIPGYTARSLIHRGDYLPKGGIWHWTSDGQWQWKGDTSSDELVGHFFADWIAYKLLPDDGDRAAIRADVSSIADGLIEHHLHLIGLRGIPTTWGKYDPQYLATLGPRDRALNSVELLSHLFVAYSITGNEKFLEAYHHIANQMGYLQNVMQIGNDSNPADINYSDEELAFLSFYPLMQAETDPEMASKYRVALTSLWGRVRSENDPLWNYMYAVLTGAKSYDCTVSRETLERIPLSTVSWDVDNSQRVDLPLQNHTGRFGESQSTVAIPPDERAVMKWNGDPFQLNGGSGGRSEDDGSFYLLPYWFGRYYHLIGCAR